jgi:hypothetical protein
MHRFLLPYLSNRYSGEPLVMRSLDGQGQNSSIMSMEPVFPEM